MDLNTELEALANAGATASRAHVAVDVALRSIGGRDLVPGAEVTNWLLDIRQALDAVEVTA